MTTETKIIDSLQEGLGCCGAKSFEDWQTSDWFVRQDIGNNKVRLESEIRKCAEFFFVIDNKKSVPATHFYKNYITPTKFTKMKGK